MAMTAWSATQHVMNYADDDGHDVVVVLCVLLLCVVCCVLCVVVVLESASCVCISTTAYACRHSEHQFLPLFMQSLETWARTTPNGLPNPNSIQGSMSLITLMQPRNLGIIVTTPHQQTQQQDPEHDHEQEDPQVVTRQANLAECSSSARRITKQNQ